MWRTTVSNGRSGGGVGPRPIASRPVFYETPPHPIKGPKMVGEPLVPMTPRPDESAPVHATLSRAREQAVCSNRLISPRQPLPRVVVRAVAAPTAITPTIVAPTVRPDNSATNHRMNRRPPAPESASQSRAREQAVCSNRLISPRQPLPRVVVRAVAAPTAITPTIVAPTVRPDNSATNHRMNRRPSVPESASQSRAREQAVCSNRLIRSQQPLPRVVVRAVAAPTAITPTIVAPTVRPESSATNHRMNRRPAAPETASQSRARRPPKSQNCNDPTSSHGFTRERIPLLSTNTPARDLTNANAALC